MESHAIFQAILKAKIFLLNLAPACAVRPKEGALAAAEVAVGGAAGRQEAVLEVVTHAGRQRQRRQGGSASQHAGEMDL